MQSNETTRKKSSQAHPAQTIVIRVTDDKSGKQEEEINCKVAVINNLTQWTGGMCLKNVKCNYHHCSYAA